MGKIENLCCKCSLLEFTVKIAKMGAKKQRILIFGAGVIGSVVGGCAAMCGYDVTLLAINQRLAELKENGLLLKRNNQKEAQKIDVHILSELTKEDVYDFVFVTLRKDQVDSALPMLSSNKSRNIVFMVNTASGYSDWIKAVGKERIMIAFPGFGGKVEQGVVHYEIVSKFIQPTTIGEINGVKTERVQALKQLFSHAGFPVTISSKMDCWQKSHIAMVAPLADAFYYDGGDNYSVAKNKKAIQQMNIALKENFTFLKQSGIGIEPFKLNVFRILPLWLLNTIMPFVFNTKWAETVMSNHALNAKNEMKQLTNEFIEVADKKGYKLNAMAVLLNENSKL
jgi:2-dehydropantoate 2-reductase